MHSSARRAGKALTGLVAAAGFALVADPPGRAASISEGVTQKQIFSQKLPNVPGKPLTVVQVDYSPGGFSAPHRHPGSSASPGVEAGARTYMELEARASATPGIEFVALRYGFFYGSGTWYTREGDMGDQVRQQQVPIIGQGQGVYSFVHIDDAAAATAAALECPPGAYNIFDGNPSPQHVWLTAFARAAGAPAPPRVSEEEALRVSGPRRGLLRDQAQGRFARESAARARVPSAPARVDLGQCALRAIVALDRQSRLI
jgi:nucleoside-diphosphate-sugar epimerase